jgi:hypothetical protein
MWRLNTGAFNQGLWTERFKRVVAEELPSNIILNVLNRQWS